MSRPTRTTTHEVVAGDVYPALQWRTAIDRFMNERLNMLILGGCRFIRTPMNTYHFVGYGPDNRCPNAPVPDGWSTDNTAHISANQAAVDLALRSLRRGYIRQFIIEVDVLTCVMVWACKGGLHYYCATYGVYPLVD